MRKFEYRTEIASQHSADSLTLLGKEGWELIDVYNGMMFLKREIEPENKIQGPLIEQVLFDLTRGKLVFPEKKDEDRFMSFLCYCKSQGIEYLLDCRQYAMTRDQFFCDNIQSVLEAYEWEAKHEECNKPRCVRVEFIENGLSMEEQERERIKKALDMHFGCKPCAAKQLGISISTLKDKMKHYGL